MSLHDQLLQAICDPNLALLMVVLGVLAIYIEFLFPGRVVPGVAGAISFLLGIRGLAEHAINWMGAVLMIAGVLVLLVEASRWIRTLLAAAGAAALATGARMLIDGSPSDARIHWMTAISLSIPFALITSFLASIAIRARRNKFHSQEVVSSERI